MMGKDQFQPGALFSERTQPMHDDRSSPVTQHPLSIVDTIRDYLQNRYGTAAVQMSADGIERIYYNGVALRDLADALTPAAPAQCAPDTTPSNVDFWLKRARSCQCCDASIDGLISGAINIIEGFRAYAVTSTDGGSPVMEAAKKAAKVVEGQP
jgi:hypothetical protein